MTSYIGPNDIVASRYPVLPKGDRPDAAALSSAFTFEPTATADLQTNVLTVSSITPTTTSLRRPERYTPGFTGSRSLLIGFSALAGSFIVLLVLFCLKSRTRHSRMQQLERELAFERLRSRRMRRAFGLMDEEEEEAILARKPKLWDVWIGDEQINDTQRHGQGWQGMLPLSAALSNATATTSTQPAPSSNALQTTPTNILPLEATTPSSLEIEIAVLIAMPSSTSPTIGEDGAWEGEYIIGTSQNTITTPHHVDPV